MTDLYISPTGNDTTGSGTSGSPWASLFKAGSVAVAGDNINIAVGTYASLVEAAVLPGVSITGADTATTIVKCQIRYHNAATFESAVTSAAGAIIQGFTMDGENSRGIGILSLSVSDVTVQFVNFKNYTDGGVFMAGCYQATPRIFAQNVKVKNCDFLNTSRDYPGYSVGALQITTLASSEIAFNTINEDEGYGIKQMADGLFKGLWVHHNTVNVSQTDVLWGTDISMEIWDMADDCIIEHNTVNAWISLIAWGKGAGQYSVICRKNTIIGGVGNSREGIEFTADSGLCEDNYIKNCGKGIYVGSEGDKYDSVIQRNAIVNCGQFGIHITNNNRRLIVRNNSIIGASSASFLLIAGIDVDLVANNCIQSVGSMVEMFHTDLSIPPLVRMRRMAVSAGRPRYVDTGPYATTYTDIDQRVAGVQGLFI